MDKRWIEAVLFSFCYPLVRQQDSKTVVFKNIIRAMQYTKVLEMYCLTVSLSQEGLKALSAPRQTMRKVLDNIGAITEW